MQALEMGSVELETVLNPLIEAEAIKIRAFLGNLKDVHYIESRLKLIEISALKIVLSFDNENAEYYFDIRTFFERASSPRDLIEQSLMNLVR